MKIKNIAFGLVWTSMISGSIAMETNSSIDDDPLTKAAFFFPSDPQDNNKFTQEQITTLKTYRGIETDNILMTHGTTPFCIHLPSLVKLVENKPEALDEGQWDRIEYFNLITTFSFISLIEFKYKINYPHGMYKVAVLLNAYGASIDEIARIVELDSWLVNMICVVIRQTDEYRLTRLEAKKRKQQENMLHLG